MRRAGGKNSGILQEKRPLLGEEEREAREIGALLVDLDLRKVRIVREIERQTLRHAVFDFAAEIAASFEVGIDEVVALHTRQRVRRCGHHPTRGDADAVQCAGMRDLLKRELPRDE